MPSVHEKPSVPMKGIILFEDAENNGYVEADPESIPYHARQNALPFSYGSVPVGFNTNNLNHVGDIVEGKVKSKAYSPSQSMVKRNQRPSIATSCPLLRRTPTREEFDVMLKERKIKNEQGINTFTVEKIQYKPKENQNELSNVAALAVATHNLDLQLVEAKRSETPTFPTTLKSFSSERCVSPYVTPIQEAMQDASISYFDEGIHTIEVAPHLVKFAQDSSEFWYKPNMSREDAVDLLRNVAPGTFLIRNSTTYPNAFGLVLRVAKPPLGVVTGPGYGDELVRHFLLEPTTWGVRLMGCKIEPIFTSLSAFVYEHSINPIGLPCCLTIPDQDILLPSNDQEILLKHKQLMTQGAACNVLYLFQSGVESLTGDDAVKKSVSQMFSEYKRFIPLEVHFKISAEGITLTDTSRKQFFRRHYPAKTISHFGMDPNNHLWSVTACDEELERQVNKSIFAFIARPLTGSKDNQSHIFCDLTLMQPASAIVSFARKVLRFPMPAAKCCKS